jgi:hypothetical protein
VRGYTARMTSSRWTRPGAYIEVFCVGDDIEAPFVFWFFVGSGCADGLSGSGLCIEFMLTACHRLKSSRGLDASR